MANTGDQAKRNRSQRRQKRERGVWVYIPAEELARTGRGQDGTAPWYRVWGGRSGSVTVRLYDAA